MLANSAVENPMLKTGRGRNSTVRALPIAPPSRVSHKALPMPVMRASRVIKIAPKAMLPQRWVRLAWRVSAVTVLYHSLKTRTRTASRMPALLHMSGGGSAAGTGHQPTRQPCQRMSGSSASSAMYAWGKTLSGGGWETGAVLSRAKSPSSMRAMFSNSAGT